MLKCDCAERCSTTKYEGYIVMFLNIMSAKNNIVEYGRDVVNFFTNKIIKNKKFNYPPK